MAPDKLWKATERAIARRLQGQRVGNRGVAAADIQTPWALIEVKCRKALPAWLLSAVAQAVRNAAPGTLPVVILHQVGERHDGDLVVLRLRDFEDWHGQLGNGLAHEGEAIP